MLNIYFDRIITTAQAKSIHSKLVGQVFNLRTVYDSDTHKTVRGKRMLSFKVYVNPRYDAATNHAHLVAQSPYVKAWFPQYEVPTLAQVQSHIASIKRMEREVLAAGAIAERSMPSPLKTLMTRGY